MKQFILVLFTSILFQPSLFSQKFVHNPSDQIQYLDAESMKPHEKNGAYYNEHWNYHVILNNGSEIYITYSISHFGGLKSSVSSARMSLINWKGNDYKVAREYHLNDLVFDEETYKMNLNPERGIWIEGKPEDKHRFYFRTQKDDILYDISIDFEDPYPALTQGDGIFELGENDQFGLFTHFPFSKVSGYVALNGDTVQVKGFGFMHHYYQTNFATKLFDKSYNYHTKTENGFAGGYFLIPKNHPTEAVGYSYHYDGQEMTILNPKNIVILDQQEIMGDKIPKTIQVNYEDDSYETFRFHLIKEKVSMLEEIGGVKKMLAKQFLGGEILFYRGKAKRIHRGGEVYFNLSLVN